MSPKSAKQDAQDAQDTQDKRKSQNEQDLEVGVNLLDLLKPGDGEDDYEEKRESSRTVLVQIGTLEVGTERFDCFVIDLSKTGTKIRTLEPLELEISSVRLHIADIGVFDAEVRWVRGTEIGLRLEDEIESPEDQQSANIEDVLRLRDQE